MSDLAGLRVLIDSKIEISSGLEKDFYINSFSKWGFLDSFDGLGLCIVWDYRVIYF